MIYYILGLISGLLLAIIIFLATKRYQIPLERSISQLENRTKEKGSIFIEEDENRELEALLDNLPKE